MYSLAITPVKANGARVAKNVAKRSGVAKKLEQVALNSKQLKAMWDLQLGKLDGIVPLRCGDGGGDLNDHASPEWCW